MISRSGRCAHRLGCLLSSLPKERAGRVEARRGLGPVLIQGDQRCAFARAPCGSVCPGRGFAEFSNTPGGVSARGLSSFSPCRFSCVGEAAWPLRTLRFLHRRQCGESSFRCATGSWEVVCASAPETISLLPGRRHDPWCRPEALPGPAPPRRTDAPTSRLKARLPGPPSCQREGQYASGPRGWG